MPADQLGDKSHIRPLNEFERSLLESIWVPVREPGLRPPGWPVWDYVARSYYARHPAGPPAEQILAGLPASPRLGNYGTYGLYWIDSFPPPSGPNPNQEIGLTIAGLYAISRAESSDRMIADEIARIVASVAKRTAALVPDPDKVAEDHIPLGPLAEWLSQPTREKPTIVPPTVVAKILMKESARVPLRTFGGNINGQIDIELSQHWLRPFVTVTTAVDYLSVAWPKRSAEESAPPEQTPLTLLQTIDYFSYVLEATDLWQANRRDKDHHLVRVRSLHAAAQLGLAASSRDEFNARVGGFWIIVDHFDVPNVDPVAYEKRYGSKGTFNRLRILVESTAGADNRADADRAVQRIRDVRLLRNEADHDGAEAREVAIAARRRLALPDVIWDWNDAWDVVRRQLADAFDTLVRVIQ